MALIAGSSMILLTAANAVDSASRYVQRLFGHQDFSPEQSLATTPNIDRHFIPRAPMSAENIDVATLNMLGRMGLKRGKEITRASHPELYTAWEMMSKRAGLPVTPQLILAESKTVNALTLSREEVVVTTSLLKILDMREVTAVLGHELGHGSSDHTTPRLLATLGAVGVGLLAGNRFAKVGGLGRLVDQTKANPGFLRRAYGRIFGSGDSASSVLAAELYMTAGAVAGTVVANQLSVRPTELDADNKGAAISGDPEGLILALRKLDNSRDASAVGNFLAYLQSGYPTTETRVKRLSAIANRPHPEPVLAAVPAAVGAPKASMVAAGPNAQVSTIAHVERMGAPAQAASVAG